MPHEYCGCAPQAAEAAGWRDLRPTISVVGAHPDCSRSPYPVSPQPTQSGSADPSAQTGDAHRCDPYLGSSRRAGKRFFIVINESGSGVIDRERPDGNGSVVRSEKNRGVHAGASHLASTQQQLQGNDDDSNIQAEL